MSPLYMNRSSYMNYFVCTSQNKIGRISFYLPQGRQTQTFLNLTSRKISLGVFQGTTKTFQKVVQETEGNFLLLLTLKHRQNVSIT